MYFSFYLFAPERVVSLLLWTDYSSQYSLHKLNPDGKQMNNFYGSPKHIYTFKKVKLVKILRLAGDDILKLDFGFPAVIKVR